MTQTRPWLPAGALRDGALAGAIADLAARWAERWFIAPRPVGARLQDGPRPSAGADACWRASGDALVLSMAPSAPQPIGCAMLGLDTGGHKVSAADQIMLERLSAICAQDLLAMLAQFFGLSGSAVCATNGEGLRFTFSIGAASQLFDLFVDNACAVRARKALLRPLPACAPPVSRESALARQRVTIGAMIGESHIDLRDMRALSPGDVVVLDKGPDDRLVLAVNDTARRETGCAIIADGAELRLRFLNSNDAQR